MSEGEQRIFKNGDQSPAAGGEGKAAPLASPGALLSCDRGVTGFATKPTTACARGVPNWG